MFSSNPVLNIDTMSIRELEIVLGMKITAGNEIATRCQMIASDIFGPMPFGLTIEESEREQIRRDRKYDETYKPLFNSMVNIRQTIEAINARLAYLRELSEDSVREL